jgi:hypothetical protein
MKNTTAHPISSVDFIWKLKYKKGIAKLIIIMESIKIFKENFKISAISPLSPLLLRRIIL